MNSKVKTQQQQDNELIHDFFMDKPGAFDSLIKKYRDMVFSICYRIIGNYDDANDCAQDTFVKVYKNLSKYQFRSSFSTWLYRIAVNTCKNHLSSLSFRMSKKTTRIENPEYAEEGYTLDIKDRTYDPAKIYERTEQEDLLQNAINTLPAKQRILIVLRDIEQRSYLEIAEITGFKEGTVKSKLSRAREKLRKKLQGVL